jgi:hypothetical protein
VQRAFVAVAVGLGVVAGRAAFDCSLTLEPLFVEKHLPPDDPLPRNTEFHVWVPVQSIIVHVNLVDSGSRPVPVAVETVQTPEGWHYLDRAQLVIARPFEDLAPGRYRLVFGPHAPGAPTPSSRTFVVTAERRTVPPLPAAEEQARLVIERCVRDLNSGCGPLVGDCAFLRLDFQQAEGHWDRHLLYDVAWWPESAEGADVSRRGFVRRLITRAESGTARVVRVPTWALDGVRADDVRLGLEITGVDHSGHRSAVARASVVVGGFLRRHAPDRTGPPRRFSGIDRRYVEDLARFERAAAVDARELFGRLEPVSPSPLGPEHDRAFERAVLEQNHDVLMSAHLRGTGGRVSIFAPVRIAAGVARPLVAPARFAEVMADLPIGAPTLKSLHLHFDGEWVAVRMGTTEWGDLSTTWDPTRRDVVRKLWDQHLAAVDLLTRQPLYQWVVEAHGGPTQRSTQGGDASATFGRPLLGHVRISSTMRDGVLKSLKVSGSPGGCRVGDLAPVVATVERVMADDLNSLEIEVEPDGLLRITAHGEEDGTRRFEGRLGKPDLRPISPTPR